MPRDPADYPPEPVTKPSSSREIFPSPRSAQNKDDEYEYVHSGPPIDPRPPLALPRKRPFIVWIGIALLLGGLVALIVVGLTSD